jgi:hypothetical protein
MPEPTPKTSPRQRTGQPPLSLPVLSSTLIQKLLLLWVVAEFSRSILTFSVVRGSITSPTSFTVFRLSPSHFPSVLASQDFLASSRVKFFSSKFLGNGIQTVTAHPQRIFPASRSIVMHAMFISKVYSHAHMQKYLGNFHICNFRSVTFSSSPNTPRYHAPRNATKPKTSTNQQRYKPPASNLACRPVNPLLEIRYARPILAEHMGA